MVDERLPGGLVSHSREQASSRGCILTQARMYPLFSRCSHYRAVGAVQNLRRVHCTSSRPPNAWKT